MSPSKFSRAPGSAADAFPTTVVGSLPRVAGWGAGDYVAALVKAGVAEVNDGEYGRGIYFGNVTDLPAFRQGGYPMAWPSGDTIGTPVLQGPLAAPAEPQAAREVAAVVAALAGLGVRRRVKVTVPSASMLAFFYPPEPIKGYPRDHYLGDCVEVLAAEAKAAFAAGADSVQFDAPTLLIAPREARASLVGLDNELLARTAGLGVREVHACWGNYWNTQVDSTTPLAAVLPALLELRPEVLGPLEVFDGVRDWEAAAQLAEAAGSFTARLAAGVLSVKSRNVEPPEVLRRRSLLLRGAYGPRLVLTSGCGFASNPESIHSFESARRKLANLAEAARLLG